MCFSVAGLADRSSAAGAAHLLRGSGTAPHCLPARSSRPCQAEAPSWLTHCFPNCSAGATSAGLKDMPTLSSSQLGQAKARGNLDSKQRSLHDKLTFMRCLLVPSTVLRIFTWINPLSPREEGTIISPFTTRKAEEKELSNLSRMSNLLESGFKLRQSDLRARSWASPLTCGT